ncbi:MAG: ABC transporter ATP-binding protein [Paracoccaceae bacterium]|nr:ABC transporter ATP-binding protein [Paracoccaceae bacterium]MDE2913777.1 ABC transporter ATP-binding protein [Paracoccaceae bacterium]
MLEVRDLVTVYGAIEALKGVTLSAKQGEITCILGPNGAGKTTLMYSIAGILKPRSGSVSVNGREITGSSAPYALACGIALVPENRLVFPSMSVEENLRAGAFRRLRGDRSAVLEDIDKAYVRFPSLKRRRDQAAGTLSGGEQQMLAVARAMMSRPNILMMDEPSLGLAPLVVSEVFSIISQLNKEGVSILLVEQNAHKALQIASHVYLLDQGRVAFSGTPGDIGEDDIIQRAYLGSKAA